MVNLFLLMVTSLFVNRMIIKEMDLGNLYGLLDVKKVMSMKVAGLTIKELEMVKLLPLNLNMKENG